MNSSSTLQDELQALVEGLERDAADGQNRARYRGEHGIVLFVREVLGAFPTPYQEDILRAFVRHRRAAVRGPHGLGKTALAAWCVLWLLSVFGADTKIPVTASAWRQLEFFLFPEIHRWAGGADWAKVGLALRPGRELLKLRITISNKEAFALASHNPALIEGAHATIIGYVFDEAKAIPDAIWDAAEGAFSGAGADTHAQAFALAISTPGQARGRFYDIHGRKAGYEDWWTRHVTLEEAVAAGRISADWARQLARQWGIESPVYINRVLGEFATSAEDGVIPLRWVELANQRWRECGGAGAGEESYGVDVARYGGDKTVIAHRVGTVIQDLDTSSRESTMQTVGRVLQAVAYRKEVPILVDVIGIGAGVVDRLREQGYNAVGINASGATLTPDASGELGFVNVRSAMWWMLREALDPEGDILLALPDEDALTGDLTSPTYSITSSGKIKVEGKDDIRKRRPNTSSAGRSTDYADAVMLAWWATQRRRGGVVTMHRPQPAPGRRRH